MHKHAKKHPPYFSSGATFIPSTLLDTIHLIYSIINFHPILTPLIQSPHDMNDTAVYVA